MDYTEIIKNARSTLGPYCKGCDVCNGRACSNKIPGPGAKGRGDVAMRNYDAWRDIRINMDTICENKEIDTTISLFGNKFEAPIFAGPVGSIKSHYSERFDDLQYNNILLNGCKKAGVCAFTGDGKNDQIMVDSCGLIKNLDGMGIPTIKPWDMGTIYEKIRLADDANAIAICMDIDAAGLPFLRNHHKPAGSKTVEELKQIISSTKKPFILKGIMTVEGAKKALKAGAYGIVVSNHGGRVLEDTPATAEVLKDIAKAVKGKMKIFVDGGIRSGADIFKALALGADAVLIARPYVVSVFGGEEEGVIEYTNKLKNELYDVMKMCGCYTLNDIKGKHIYMK